MDCANKNIETLYVSDSHTTQAYQCSMATRWLRDAWGLQGTLTRLPGFQDENYRVHTDDGTFVFRISHPSVKRSDLDEQNRAMQRVADALPGIAPCPQHSLAGRLIETDAGYPGRFARLLTYVAGTTWATCRPVSLATHQSLGTLLARLDRILREIETTSGAHDAVLAQPLDVINEWDLRRSGEVVAINAREVHDRGRRALTHHWVQRFQAEVMPIMSTLPVQMIHNDANDYNILVASDPAGKRVSGIIDFADTMESLRVAEPAIAISYTIQREFDVLACASALLAGYHAAYPLTPTEIAVLPILVAMRLCTSATIAARNHRLDPDNAYLQINAQTAWRALEQWSSVDPALFEPAFAGRMTAALALANTRADRIRTKRARQLSPSLSLGYQTPLHIVRGRGQFLIDHRGRAFLDGVNNVCHVGHCHPRVVAAACAQIATLNTNTRYLHEAIIDYADALCATLPPSLSVCTFVCSGSEANDLALRMARTVTGQRDIMVIDGAYHGNTSAVIEVSPYKFDGPGGSGASEYVHKLPMPDRYRGPFGYQHPDAGVAYARAADAIVERLAARGRTPALLMVESLLGCGGQIELPPGYLAALYERVRAAGGLCLADEVQVGFGRVGTHFWGFQTHDVVPDIVTMGKPMGNGHPLAAVVTTPEIAQRFANGMEYFNTFGGNPVSCRIGASVLDVIASERLQEHARVVGDQLRAGLRGLMDAHEVVGDVRGRGLFLGLELVDDRSSKRPAAERACAIVEHAKTRGVLLSTDGPLRNVIKIKPPMVFDTDDATRVIQVLDEALSSNLSAGARST